MCEKPPLIAKVPELAADHLRQADALAADLLHRAKDSIAREEDTKEMAGAQLLSIDSSATA